MDSRVHISVGFTFGTWQTHEKLQLSPSLAQSPDGEVDAVVILLGAKTHVVLDDVVEVGHSAAVFERHDLGVGEGPVPVAAHLPQNLHGAGVHRNSHFLRI